MNRGRAEVRVPLGEQMSDFRTRPNTKTREKGGDSMYSEPAKTSLSKIHKLIGLLKGKELEFVTKGFAMISYNASIARVLEKGGVDKFEAIAWDEVQKLDVVNSLHDFDVFHAAFVSKIIEIIRTNRGEELSYGQAQKPVNVFLKDYVDRANLPEQEMADRLKPFLHVPLDSNMMEFFYEQFPAEYESLVHPVITTFRQWGKEQGYSSTPGDRWFLSLVRILSKQHYMAWQNLFRSLYPERPVLLDMVYELKSRGIPIKL